MMTDHERAMMDAINAARVERGVHALAADGRLTAEHGRPLRVEVRYEP